MSGGELQATAYMAEEAEACCLSRGLLFAKVGWAILVHHQVLLRRAEDEVPKQGTGVITETG